jgi:hypothetical protein
VEETVLLEDQMSYMDAMVSNVELLSLADELLGEESFEGIEFASLEDILIDSSNFAANDPHKRPEFWKEVRMRRILVKEYVDRLEGLDEDTMKEKRNHRVQDEEKLMVTEVLNNGRLLNLTPTIKPRSVSAAAIAVTADNFNPDNSEIRPPAWKAIRFKRVLAKEPENIHPDEAFLDPNFLKKVEEVRLLT